MSALRIGVCGNGTVGGGTIELLRSQAVLLGARAGRELLLTRVGARRDREDCPTGDVPVHRDLLEVARADDVDVVVESIGGTTLAKDIVETALRCGKSVVTANKALIAEHGNELLALAEECGGSLLCEAAVAGAVPILKALRDGMAANTVSELSGIINGTGNFILTEMGAHQRPFDEVLAEAQALGYAEADPTFDVEGTDAAHKLSILAAMAFSTPLNFSAVFCEGISAVTPADIQFADELGYRIKHLGIAKRHADGIELRVHPTLLPKGSLLANVDGVLNAVRLQGHAAGETVYSGAGAGRLPTASAVVADIVDIARAGGNSVHCLGVPVSNLESAPTLPMEAVTSAWYLRMQAEDRPGVMSQLANCLSAEGISIEALIQKPPKGAAATVPVVVLTNSAREEALRRAVTAISALPGITHPHCIRIESAN
ncbi:homoserine dehydrogenase [Congregibacter brevis]|uniref:Homoserine dehydrogenase n=1 Tax=Congregibacter brevis TaxID=3081201 RepID=A0ABZ0IAX8_9GAMM|nr:homoserine dehydrogenase [Congregibacter sp. IMCC45268]